jgi:dolichyl-phosphate-mannose--protein O-mannosyl transferase
LNEENTSPPFSVQWHSFAILMGVALLLFSAIGTWGYFIHGNLGLVAAAVAVSLCAAAAALAMTCLSLPVHAFAKSFCSIFARTALPLVAGLWLAQNFPQLKEVAFLGMLTAAYLVMLCTETILASRGDKNLGRAFKAMLSKKEVV